MSGDHLSLRERAARPRRAIGDVAPHVHSLRSPAGLQIERQRVRGVKIVGLAGLNGSGRTTLLQVLFGELRGSGRVELFRQPCQVRSPREAIRRGIGLVPENHKTEGLNLGASLSRYAAGPSLPSFRYVTNRCLADFARPVLDDLGDGSGRHRRHLHDVRHPDGEHRPVRGQRDRPGRDARGAADETRRVSVCRCSNA